VEKQPKILNKLCGAVVKRKEASGIDPGENRQEKKQGKVRGPGFHTGTVGSDDLREIRTRKNRIAIFRREREGKCRGGE